MTIIYRATRIQMTAGFFQKPRRSEQSSKYFLNIESPPIQNFIANENNLTNEGEIKVLSHEGQQTEFIAGRPALRNY